MDIRKLRLGNATSLIARFALVAGIGMTMISTYPALAQAKPYSAEFQGAIAAFRQENPGVSTAEAVRRIDGQVDRVRLLERVSRDFPDTFGGSWYDGATGIQHLQATTAEAARSLADVAAAARVPVRVHQVTFSYRQLRQEFMRTDAGAHPALGPSAMNRTGIDVHANRVVVAVPANDVIGARAALGSAAGLIQVVPTNGVESVPDLCDRRNCGVPMRSGIILWKGSYSSPACSLGYTATASDGSHWAITAGHCGAQNTVWGHGEQRIGPMRQTRTSGSVDVGRIRIDNPYWQRSSWGWFFSPSNPDVPTPVNLAITLETTIQIGETVCLSAWHSVIGNACGTIAQVSDPNRSGMVRVRNFDACGGDSGGGWYWLSSTGARWAYGIHSASNEGCHVAGGNSWFSSLPDINTFWDSSNAARIRVDHR